jgi:hypothetical protein
VSPLGQKPLLSQQPWQLVGPHDPPVQTPAEQVSPLGQFAQAEPPVPHTGPPWLPKVTQVLLGVQHPSEQLCGVQGTPPVQTPPLQLCPVPH